MMFFFVVILKREKRFIVTFAASFQFNAPILCTYIPQHISLFQEFTSILRNRDASFPACVSMLTQADYGFYGWLVVKQEKEKEFKITGSGHNFYVHT